MSLQRVAVPNGVEQKVGADELFFSTTDRQGRIRSGNSVFARISQFSIEELVGSPHNIVRHPEMPAGVFRLIWDRLYADRPVGTYVKNLARDGSSYWVFATVTPLGTDGYLSVRMAPRTPLFTTVQRIYEYVLEAEREAAERDGLNRREVARLGKERLEEMLRRLGFHSHDEFLAEALSGEVAARGRMASGTYARPWAEGAIAEVLSSSGALEEILASLVQRLDSYRTLSERLERASTNVLDIARRLERTVDTAQAASTRVADTAPVLHNVARVMATPARTAVAELEQLGPRLRELRGYLTELRFRIALASLHNDMVAAFAAEVADGAAPASSLSEVPHLCDTMHDSVLEMSAKMQEVNRTLHDVVAEVNLASERLQDFYRFLGQWRILVVRRGAERTLADLVQPIDEEFAASWSGMDMLRDLVREFQAAIARFDVDAVEAQLTRIRSAAAASRALV